MKVFLVVSILFGSFYTSAQLTTWRAFTDSIPTLSSPRACDLNNDGVLDVIIGGGTDGASSNYGIMAYNGIDGTLLWKRASRNEVFGSPIFQDITNDGIKDVFITGRQAQLLAINGSTGQLIWDYFPFSTDPAVNGLYNFYNPQFIPDVNNDGMPDLLVTNGGNHAAPDWETNRPPGHIMVINSLNGQLLAQAVVPDSAETYCSPLVVDLRGDGNLWILYGTGGETLGGSFWACPLNDLLQTNSLSNSIQLDSDANKGYIAPAAVALNSDNQYDIIIQSFGGKVKKIKGADFTQLWAFQLPDTESSAEPVIGNFTGEDAVPDVLAIIFKGSAPSYSDFYQIMINGLTGQVAFKDSLGTFGYVSANAIDFDNDGRDEGLVSVTYFENGHYKHRLQLLNFAAGTVNQISTTRAGVNLGSTPLLTDLDGDNLVDLVYVVKKDSLNPVGWKGIYVQREELNIAVPNSGIAWGSYLGTYADGIYNLDVTDCGPGSVITSVNIAQPSCNGFADGSINITSVTGTAPFTYQWSTASSSATISNLSAGNYTVTVTSASGCFETRSFSLNNPYFISFGGVASPTCVDGVNGSAIVGSSGCQCQFSTCTFLWDNGITTKPNYSLASGWHSVTINHPDGCVVVDSVFVPNPLPVIVDTALVQNTCFGESIGSITLSPSNFPPHVFSWSNNVATNTIENLQAGNYSVTVLDGRNCSQTLEFTITEPAEILVSSQVQNIACNGGATGEIQLQAQGGNGSYTYWINQAIASAINSNLEAGIYNIYATDLFGCSSQTTSVTLTEPTALSLSLTSTIESIGLDGTATATVNGGTAPYSYLWNDVNMQPENMAIYLNSGWYTVVVTDANNCQISDSVFVDSEVGITETQTTQITVFPNPTNDMIHINGLGEYLIIRDIHGKLIREMNFTNDINVHQLSAGIYTLEIKTASKTVKTIRFSKIN